MSVFPFAHSSPRSSLSENKAIGVMKPGHVFTIEPMINAGERCTDANTPLELSPRRNMARYSLERQLDVDDRGRSTLCSIRTYISRHRHRLRYPNSACIWSAVVSRRQSHQLRTSRRTQKPTRRLIFVLFFYSITLFVEPSSTPCLARDFPADATQSRRC